MIAVVFAALMVASASAGFTQSSIATAPTPAASESPFDSPAPQASPAASPAPSTSPVARASAEPDLAKARVDALLRGGHADAAAFSASFLAQVPVAQIDTIVVQLTAGLGRYVGIDGASGTYAARFAKGTDEIFVHLDGERKIDGLFFKTPKFATSSLDDALANLARVGANATLSYVVVEGRSERAALAPSMPLAVGSTFKLAVLAALRDEIAAGRRHWNDVEPLQSAWKSLPSGVLQTWPDGTPITLATYATEMISISDNAAADALIALVGPKALAPYAGRNVPFLTTRESFILAGTTGAAQARAYRAASTPEARSAVLTAVDRFPEPTLATFTGMSAVPMLDVEWHYSVRELCALMARVAVLPLMSINAGPAGTADFARVAYKGGSDRGVINLTTQVLTKRGSRVCFSATLNNATTAFDDAAFELAYGAAIASLADR